MPRTPISTSKKQQLTYAQLAAYDDILTDALIDHVSSFRVVPNIVSSNRKQQAYYWTTIPKNRPAYHASRGIREEDITKIIQTHLIVTPNPAVAEDALLAVDGLKRFYRSLKTSKEKDDFKAHLRRYMCIYQPDCPFEVNATNRYTISSYEASITARRFIRRNETIKYLAGIQVTVTPEEEAQLALRKKDFSLVVSSRSKLTSLFMGPARFANHDCSPNARLVTRGQAGIEVVACRDIEVGEEITVSYSDGYFGENNCECLCHTCEKNLANGWKPVDGAVPVHTSIEGSPAGTPDGYSLRRRRRDRSVSVAGSRTSSVTPDIRPRILRGKRSQTNLGERASTTDSVDADQTGMATFTKKRSIDAAFLSSPPITPGKRLKKHHYHRSPIKLEIGLSRSSSETGLSSTSAPSEDGKGSITDATSPEDEKPSLHIPSPELSPVKQSVEIPIPLDNAGLSEISPSSQQTNASQPILPTKEITTPGISIAHPGSSEPLLPVTGINSTLTDGQSKANTLPRRAEVQQTRKHRPWEFPEEPLITPLGTEEAEEMDRLLANVQVLGDGKPDDAAAEIPQQNSDNSTQENSSTGVTPASTPATEPNDDEPASTASSATPKPKQKRTKPNPTSLPPTQTSRRQRVPGDYTLTPLLLSEPQTAWVHCTNCSAAFVQKDAYYTRSNCFRCERHSKLYGYVWPKTAPAGRDDKEERILDHRVVNRFLHPEDEARARGRKPWRERLSLSSSQGGSESGRGSKESTPGRRDRMSGGDGERERERGEAESAVLAGLRRSGRVRRASARALGDD
jgi:histone-lysine N-methyltransferase SUV420H